MTETKPITWDNNKYPLDERTLISVNLELRDSPHPPTTKYVMQCIYTYAGILKDQQEIKRITKLKDEVSSD